MRIVAFNGSPRKNGNTSQLLDAALAAAAEAGAETERVDIVPGRPRGCTACMGCAKNQDSRCVLTDDPMNDWIEMMKNADGVLLGSPTYFANVSAEMKAFLDRVGMVGIVNGRMFARKPGAAVIAVRRGGAVPAFDAINHMMQINRMLLVGSTYWNFAFGLKPGEATGDEEGMANMRDLGETMAWLAGKLAE